MLKICIPSLYIVFLKALNHLKESEKSPPNLSEGYITTIHKKGDMLDPNNYRGLSISNCLGKLFTKILTARLIMFLEEYKVIDASQIGFRPKSRTSDHILVLKTICDIYRSRGKGVYMCFIDLAKAFDSVNRELLWYKLVKYKLSTKFINITKSLYTDLHTSVKTPRGLTDKFPIEIGTRQGCHMSPMLFNLFVNDLPRFLQLNESGFVYLHDAKIRCLLYADDIVLMSDTQNGLQKSLQLLETYCNKWQLVVNVKKTKIIIFHKKFKCYPVFFLYNKRLEVVKEHTYLGIALSRTGSFKPAIDDLCGKATRAYYSLRKEFNFHNGTHPRVIMKLFHMLIAPILTYSSEIWGCYGWKGNKILNIKKYMFNNMHCYEKLQSKMCKMALGLKRHVPDIIAKAEMGVYPVMGKIVKNIYSFWQHAIKTDTTSLVSKALQACISADRAGHETYYTRVKAILFTLEMGNYIYAVPDSKIKLYSDTLKYKFYRHYEAHFFRNLKPSGKTALYFKIKRNYNYEKYLDFKLDPQLRRNVSALRLSAHCLPVQQLRARGVPRDMRLCHMCDAGVIGTEEHVLLHCGNHVISQLRKQLLDKLHDTSSPLCQLPTDCQLHMLMLATDPVETFYFAIFLKKIYEAVKSWYST